MDTDALIEKDYLLQLKEGPISKFIKYYENIISDDEKSKLSSTSSYISLYSLKSCSSISLLSKTMENP